MLLKITHFLSIGPKNLYAVQNIEHTQVLQKLTFELDVGGVTKKYTKTCLVRLLDEKFVQLAI